MQLFGKGVSFFILLVVLLIVTSSTFSQTINISPKTLYFGRISESKEAIRELLIYNISIKPLTINKLRFQGPDASLFSLVADPTPVNLGLAQLLVVPIKFVPNAEGAVSAQLMIESNASTSPNLADLTGEGTDLANGFITFERIFGQPDGDGAGSIRELPDGGYIIAGATTLIEADYSDASLIKIDKYGQIEWSQIYGDDDWSEGFAEVVATADGGYLAVGSHSHTEQLGEPDIYLVKTDASGTRLWEKSYYKSVFKADGASEIIPALDGGFIIAGSTQTEISKDAYLIKIDDNGKVIWEKTYGGAGGENAASIKPTGDGGYVFVGSTSTYYTGSTGDFDFYLVKIDAAGNVVREKHYGGTDWDQAGSVIVTSDGGYLIAGWTASPEFGAVARDVFLVKLDAALNKQWQKLFGWEHHDGAAEVIATNDGGYLIAGSSERYYDAPLETWRPDIYVIKTDADANEEWSKTFGGIHNEGASCVRQVSDGGYIISGSTSSYSKDSDIYLLKLDRSGGFSPVFDYRQTLAGDFHLAQNYPNPFNNSTMIQYQLPYKSNIQIDIYNIRGQIIRTLAQHFQQAGSYEIQFEAGELTSGLYFYQVKTDYLSETKRMLLMK